jgi:hypothetical protein
VESEEDTLSCWLPSSFFGGQQEFDVCFSSYTARFGPERSFPLTLSLKPSRLVTYSHPNSLVPASHSPKSDADQPTHARSYLAFIFSYYGHNRASPAAYISSITSIL